jgi:hypothetical protein
MALNKFILDMSNTSFEAWRDETLASQQKIHTQEMSYLQHHFQPRAEYESQVGEYIETNKSLREEFMKKKTSATLQKWLVHYSTMPDKSNVSEIYTAFN